MRNSELVCLALLLSSCGGLERQPEASESTSADVPDGSEPAGASTPTGEATAPALGPADRSAAVQDCVQRFPATLPFDAGWPPSANPMPMQPGVSVPARPPDDVVAECAARAGTNCDVASFLSQAAGRCAARASAPEAALEPAVGFALPWLFFDAETRRVEWLVSAAVCCGDTWRFNVDATSGGATAVSHLDPPLYCTADCSGVPIERPD